MGIYTDSKESQGAHDPDNAVDASFSRYEPLITPDGIRNRILWGVKLASAETKKEMPNEVIQDAIMDAVSLIEQDAGIQIFPTQHSERQAFDRNEYVSQGYMRLKCRPVQSVESLVVLTANNQEIWKVSNDWIDAGYMSQGLIYIVPINVAVAPSAGSGGGANAAAFLALLGQQGWVPAYWNVKYTTGWKNGHLPRAINLLIGYQTGINILEQLAASNAKSGSKSLGIDGLSQSSSNSGPEVYTKMIEGLEKKRDKLIGKVKNQYGLKIFSGNL